MVLGGQRVSGRAFRGGGGPCEWEVALLARARAAPAEGVCCWGCGASLEGLVPALGLKGLSGRGVLSLVLRHKPLCPSRPSQAGVGLSSLSVRVLGARLRAGPHPRAAHGRRWGGCRATSPPGCLGLAKGLPGM